MIGRRSADVRSWHRRQCDGSVDGGAITPTMHGHAATSRPRSRRAARSSASSGPNRAILDGSPRLRRVADATVRVPRDSSPRDRLRVIADRATGVGGVASTHRSPSIAIDRSVGRPAGDEADLPRGPSGVRGLRNSPRSHAPAGVCRSAVPLARLGEGPAWRRGKPSIRDLDESCRATKQLPSHPFFGPLLDPLRPPRPRRVRWFVRRGGVLLPRAGGARHGRPEPRWLDRRR